MLPTQCIAFLFVCLSACVLVGATNYSDINTDVNFESYVTDPPAVKKYLDCYMDKAPCDEIASHYKRHVSEAVKEACKDCSPRLKHNIKWIIKAMRLHYPKEYEEFRERYDPSGENFDHIEAAVIDF